MAVVAEVVDELVVERRRAAVGSEPEHRLDGRDKEDHSMIRRLIMSLLFALVAGLVIKSLPDIARYLKIREM